MVTRSGRPAAVAPRAERKLGLILKRMAETGERAAQDAGRPSEVSRGATHTLADLGIPRDRASRAMQLAEVPQEQFDAALGIAALLSCAAPAVGALTACFHG